MYIGQFFASINGKAFIQDTFGNIFVLGEQYFTDDDAAMDVTGITPLVDNGNNHRKFWNSITFIGDRIPVSSLVTLTYSDDDYNNFVNPRTADLGTDKPAIYSLGQARRRAYKWVHTDNQPLRLTALEVDVTDGS